MVSQICDFGCAKFLDNVAATTLTGTYKWMAPEVNFSLVLFSAIYLDSCHTFPDSEEGASIIPLRCIFLRDGSVGTPGTQSAI